MGILAGLKQHPWRASARLFASFAVLWTLVEGLTYFIPGLDLSGVPSLIVVIAISLIYSAAIIRRPSKVVIPIRHTNTALEIKFGDLFEENGFRAIAVNEFFDSELGLPVSENSLHGVFLTKCFGGHRQSFDAVVGQCLQHHPSQTVIRPQGKTTRYPIGTTVLVPVNDDRYLCFALCETDIKTCKAHADVPTLWEALRGLQKEARIQLGGLPLVLPLVGSGLAGVGLSPRELLNLIILSVITEAKQQQVATYITIVLTPDRFDEIDLGEVRAYWR